LHFQVYVFDDLISHPLVLASMEYYQGKRNWKPLFKDDVGTEPKEQFKIGNGIPWKVWDNPVKFGSTRVGTTFSSIISALATKSSPQGGNSYRFHMLYFMIYVSFILKLKKPCHFKHGFCCPSLSLQRL